MSDLYPPSFEERQKLLQIVKDRQITHLFHFTSVSNLESIFQHGLMSKKDLESKVGQEYVETFDSFDELRLDNRTDAISISISHPNVKVLKRYMKSYPKTKWTALVLSVDIILDKSCLFYPMNAASKYCTNNPYIWFEGVQGFERLFCNSIKENWEVSNRCSNHIDNNKYHKNHIVFGKDPTSIQAEILCFDLIEPKYIKGCITDSDFLLKTLSDRYPLLPIQKVHFSFFESDGRDTMREAQLLCGELSSINSLTMEQITWWNELPLFWKKVFLAHLYAPELVDSYWEDRDVNVLKEDRDTYQTVRIVDKFLNNLSNKLKLKSWTDLTRLFELHSIKVVILDNLKQEEIDFRKQKHRMLIDFKYFKFLREFCWQECGRWEQGMLRILPTTIPNSLHHLEVYAVDGFRISDEFFHHHKDLQVICLAGWKSLELLHERLQELSGMKYLTVLELIYCFSDWQSRDFNDRAKISRYKDTHLHATDFIPILQKLPKLSYFKFIEPSFFGLGSSTISYLGDFEDIKDEEAREINQLIGSVDCDMCLGKGANPYMNDHPNFSYPLSKDKRITLFTYPVVSRKLPFRSRF